MATYAVGISSPPLSHASGARVPAKRGFFGRLLDRMIASRMRQAEIEVRRQMALIPPHVRERMSYSLKNDRDLPFVR